MKQWIELASGVISFANFSVFGASKVICYVLLLERVGLCLDRVDDCCKIVYESKKSVCLINLLLIRLIQEQNIQLAQEQL